MRWSNRQHELAAAVVNPQADCPAGFLVPHGRLSSNRFAVYRNNVIVGLIDALQARFPATCRIVGEEFFRAMAREYVLAELPTTPVLFHYGDRFLDFVAQFEAADCLPYLADVARIERALSDAYHASDAEPLGTAALSGLASYQIAALSLLLHPSVRIVRSKYTSVSIWRMNVGNGTPSSIEFEASGEDALIVRPRANVDLHLLGPGCASFLESLAQGSTLMAATEAALSESTAFDLSADLALLIGAGVFIGFSFATDAGQSPFTARHSASSRIVARGDQTPVNDVTSTR